MNLNRFTQNTQIVLQESQKIALKNNHASIEPLHILSAINQVNRDIIQFLADKSGVNYAIYVELVEAALKSISKAQVQDVYLSNDSNKLLIKSEDLLTEYNDAYVSVELLFLSFLSFKNTASKIMSDSGFNKSKLKQAIVELRKGAKVTDSNQEASYQALSKYAKNLNESVHSGKLDPVIGRDDEIRRVLQILSRRTKNNPILIGEPGVGKTAIAEGIAHRIVNGDVPENLKSKIVYSLDIGAIIAGAKFKGQFEERLKAVVKEVTDADGEIILFIDEIHTLVGAGGGEGAMDAANILKPALSRGELRVVGATTLNEYQKYFEKDKALVRRFQTVLVDEPNIEDAISILRGIKERYESHHQVLIKDSAVISAVELSQRYITDRQLPDKAIDLIDEAASKLKMEINSKPVELDEIERKIRQLEIEKEAIKREKDAKKLTVIEKTLSELSDEQKKLKATWELEKNLVDEIQKIKNDIETLKLEAEKLERDGDYGRVAEIRYGKLNEKETQLIEKKNELTQVQQNSKMIKEEVDVEEIAEVISKWTGIPLQKMMESEGAKLLKLEDELSSRVVGQYEAIESLSDAVRRSRSGLHDKNKPIGSFLFMGTTGVGKTELAKTLASYLFNDDSAMVRLDMSEYQEKHAVSRLIGAPPGYVGYDEGGQLTEAVRRKPYSIILLDEIEKAHADVYNILLQVLDDGRLTDSKGRIVNFKNTIIIMTSNLGADLIHEEFNNAKGNENQVAEAVKAELLELMKLQLKPEFLNRIDELILFRPLNKDNIMDIVKIQLEGVKELLKEKDIELFVTDEALQSLVEQGFDPFFGARPIKRLIQKNVLNELSKQLIGGNIDTTNNLVLDAFDGKMVFRKPIYEKEELNP
ncbi:MAG: ATP-dependent chaperone ClpB [Bacteroidota bacterium]|nr:ATP-dependent chaperone ClpB [Bacteroidota bacterium]